MKQGPRKSRLMLVCANAGVTAACLLTTTLTTRLPVLEAAGPSLTMPLKLAPGAALVLAAMLVFGRRTIVGAALGMLGAALLVRPDNPGLAIGISITVLFSAGWSAIYTRHAIGNRLTELVLTLRGVGIMLALTVGTFAVWTATLASLITIILGEASRDHAALEAALLGWAIPNAIFSALLLPPALLAARFGMARMVGGNCAAGSMVGGRRRNTAALPQRTRP